jgi:hypothetical protein
MATCIITYLNVLKITSHLVAPAILLASRFLLISKGHSRVQRVTTNPKAVTKMTPVASKKPAIVAASISSSPPARRTLAARIEAITHKKSIGARIRQPISTAVIVRAATSTRLLSKNCSSSCGPLFCRSIYAINTTSDLKEPPE